MNVHWSYERKSIITSRSMPRATSSGSSSSLSQIISNHFMLHLTWKSYRSSLCCQKAMFMGGSRHG